MLWVRISIRTRCTTLCDKVCQWLAADRLFSPGPPGFLHQKNWPPRYNWNIVESGVKQHQTTYMCNRYRTIETKEAVCIGYILTRTQHHVATSKETVIVRSDLLSFQCQTLNHLTFKGYQNTSCCLLTRYIVCKHLQVNNIYWPITHLKLNINQSINQSINQAINQAIVCDNYVLFSTFLSVAKF